jgi:murein DD-endopeptidase MepM/ murein hydrolase activator NlpD
VQIRQRTIIVSALILLGLAFLVIGILMQRPIPKFYAHSLRNPQEADATAGYPIATDKEGEFWTAEFEPNLSHLRSLERYQLPLARRFSHPAGKLTQIVKQSPTGIEFDGPDKKVHAAANGLVLAVTKTRGYPGKTILLGHRLPNAQIVQTLYAGLLTTKVRVGERVAANEAIGERKEPLYFEVRHGSSIDLELEVIAGETLNTPHPEALSNRADPLKFLQLQGLDSPPRAPDALTIIREERTNPDRAVENMQLDSKSALKFQELMEK